MGRERDDCGVCDERGARARQRPGEGREGKGREERGVFTVRRRKMQQPPVVATGGGAIDAHGKKTQQKSKC